MLICLDQYIYFYDLEAYDLAVMTRKHIDQNANKWSQSTLWYNHILYM